MACQLAWLLSTDREEWRQQIKSNFKNSVSLNLSLDLILKLSQVSDQQKIQEYTKEVSHPLF